MHYIAQQGLKRQIEKQKQDEQRYQLMNRVSGIGSNRTAADEVPFQRSHRTSMTDALKEVRKNKSTIPDGHYLRPENHKGFYE